MILNKKILVSVFKAFQGFIIPTGTEMLSYYAYFPY